MYRPTSRPVAALTRVLRSEGSVDVLSDIAGVASVAALARVLRSEGSLLWMSLWTLSLLLRRLGLLWSHSLLTFRIGLSPDLVSLSWIGLFYAASVLAQGFRFLGCLLSG